MYVRPQTRGNHCAPTRAAPAEVKDSAAAEVRWTSRTGPRAAAAVRERDKRTPATRPERGRPGPEEGRSVLRVAQHAQHTGGPTPAAMLSRLFKRKVGSRCARSACTGTNSAVCAVTSSGVQCALAVCAEVGARSPRTPRYTCSPLPPQTHTSAGPDAKQEGGWRWDGGGNPTKKVLKAQREALKSKSAELKVGAAAAAVTM